MKPNYINIKIAGKNVTRQCNQIQDKSRNQTSLLQDQNLIQQLCHIHLECAQYCNGMWQHCLIEQLLSLSSEANAIDQLPRLSVWVLVRLLHCHELLKQPAHDMHNVLVWDLQGFLWSSKLLNKTVPCDLISNFISTCTLIFRDTHECHRVVGRNIAVIPVGMFWEPEELSRLLDLYFSDLIIFWIHRHRPRKFVAWKSSISA